MNPRTLVRVVVGLLVVGFFLVGPQIWNRRVVLAHASGYRRAELLVTSSACVGGQTNRHSDGTTSTSPLYCWLTGTIDGADEELSIDKPSIPAHPPGSRVSVWFNPEVRGGGINHETLRVRWGDVESVGDFERRAIRSLAVLAVLPAILTVVLNVFHVRGRRFGVSDEEASTFRIVDDAPRAALGIPLLALGLTFLGWQVGASVAWGGVVVGAVLGGVGLALLRRPVVTLDRTSHTLMRARVIGPWRTVASPKSLAAPLRVGIARVEERSPSDGGDWTVRLRAENEAELLGTGRRFEVARECARDLAGFLGCELEALPREEPVAPGMEASADEHGGSAAAALAVDVPPGEFLEAAPEDRIRSWLRFVPILAVVAGVATLWWVPSLGGWFGRSLVDPLTGYPMLRGAGFRLMARDDSDETVLALVRLANCLDPVKDAEPVRGALTALATLRGEPSAPEAGLDAEIGRANLWAAARFRRPIDANGGVLGWFEPHRSFRSVVDLIASSNPREGWSAWDHFGAGVLDSPGMFVCAVGSALADPRPISFAIKRGPFFAAGPAPGGPAFEGQPEPIAEHAGVALARTVGEALALDLWTHDGVGDREFPEDFWSWWDGWARDHRLPPRSPPRPSG